MYLTAIEKEKSTGKGFPPISVIFSIRITYTLLVGVEDTVYTLVSRW